MQETTIVIDKSDAYSRRYTIRRVTLKGETRTIVSTLPPDIVERAARKRGLSLPEFIERYEVEFLYDGVEGAYLHFVEKETVAAKV